MTTTIDTKMNAIVKFFESINDIKDINECIKDSFTPFESLKDIQRFIFEQSKDNIIGIPSFINIKFINQMNGLEHISLDMTLNDKHYKVHFKTIDNTTIWTLMTLSDYKIVTTCGSF